jgi:hypothetical protein
VATPAEVPVRLRLRVRLAETVALPALALSGATLRRTEMTRERSWLISFGRSEPMLRPR